MNSLQERNRMARTTEPEPLTTGPDEKLGLKNAAVPKGASAHRSFESRKAPATPFMVTPVIAWRKLCVKTGGAVCMGTFYQWIKTGKVYTVRMGAKLFVPVTELDDLIKRCLAGERN